MRVVNEYKWWRAKMTAAIIYNLFAWVAVFDPTIPGRYSAAAAVLGYPIILIAHFGLPRGNK